MSCKFPTVLAIAAALILLPSSGFAQTDSAPTDQTTSNAPASADASQQTAKLVAATAVFTQVIDSRSASPGSQFQAKLLKKVHLQDGPELPAGTMLVGQIVNDDTQASGQAKLALRFTQANLKNGQNLPIKATIIDVYQVPDNIEAAQYGVVSSPPDWDGKATAIDQVDVLSGVDLHSNIASSNSGVFVSTKKDDIKLSKNVGIQLAIGTQAANQASLGGN